MIPDQKLLWNKKHGLGEHEVFRDQPSSFAKMVEPKLPKTSKILELGCGVAVDADYFAHQGHNVLATDFSSTVIERDRQLFKHPNLRLAMLDITQPFDFADGTFDVVYAHLSLHYYPDDITQEIFHEIARVLKPNGIFAFACKTPDDPKYGDGQKLGQGLFVASNGHARHFFSEKYARKLLSSDFRIDFIQEVKEQYGSTFSAFIRCIVLKDSNVA